MLPPARPRLVLVVAGCPGNDSKELGRLCQDPLLKGRVRLLGHREEVPEVLAAADIFAFPSLYKGFGGAVIEAMALGLPVVASDLPALREVVEEGRNGLLIKPGSSSEMAAALQDLLDDRPRAIGFGSHSRRLYESRFTLESSVSRMIALYARIAPPSVNPG
ncbi:MAG: glycosyltransferase family 4 protein [Acidobacteriota bacterium]